MTFPKLQRPTKFKPKYFTEGQTYEISVKLDGIRCIILNGKALTRTLKPIPNKHIRASIEAMGLPDGYGGEIVILDERGVPSFQLAQSQVMAFEGTPDYKFVVFETINHPQVLDWVIRSGEDAVYDGPPEGNPGLYYIRTWKVTTLEQVYSAFSKYVALGYEGLIIKETGKSYDRTRSFKLKQRESTEATLVDMNPLVRKDGSVAPLLGAMTVKMADGKVFSVGTGFNALQRSELWTNRQDLLAKQPLVSVAYDSLSGHGIPRFPTFNGFRHKDTCLA